MAEIFSETPITSLPEAVAFLGALPMKVGPEPQASVGYPPAFPWARLLDADDLADFLDEMAASAITNASSDVALAEVERTCATWRLIAEAQHGHNTAPGPSVAESADRLSRLLAQLAPLREDAYESPLHHAYRVGHDLPETGGTS